MEMPEDMRVLGSINNTLQSPTSITSKVMLFLGWEKENKTLKHHCAIGNHFYCFVFENRNDHGGELGAGWSVDEEREPNLQQDGGWWRDRSRQRSHNECTRGERKERDDLDRETVESR